MNIVRSLAIAAFAATSIAAVTTIAFAQAGRDAAVHKCIQQAQAEFPGSGVGDALIDRNRTAAYKACMTSAGFLP
jgi:hypothetical protein